MGAIPQAVHAIIAAALLQTPSISETSAPPAIALWGPFGTRDKPASVLGKQMATAARMALRHGREKLGIEVRLLKASEDGIWGAPTAKLVDMIYRGKAVAIIGPTDPAAAHVALQLATRARVTLLFPALPDPTLTQAGSPWIFSILADDRVPRAGLRELIHTKSCREAGDSYPLRSASADRARPDVGAGFRRELRKRLQLGKDDPLHPAVLATFDAVLLAVKAIKERGEDRKAVRDHIARMKITGATGSVSFLAGGCRDAKDAALRYHRGCWKPVRR